MRWMKVGPLALMAVMLMAGPAMAHEVTYRGTVAGLETAKYAQPDGTFREVRELRVTIVDAKSKKPSEQVFTITAATRVFRGTAVMPLADARIEAGETVSVSVDHDKPGDEAITVRLAAKR